MVITVPHELDTSVCNILVDATMVGITEEPMALLRRASTMMDSRKLINASDSA
jgi:hypothetical protein